MDNAGDIPKQVDIVSYNPEEPDDPALLKLVAYLAHGHLELKQIAEVIGMEWNDFKEVYSQKKSLFKAIRKGRLMALAQLNHSVISSAIQGSNPAQVKAKVLMDNIADKDEKHEPN